MALKYTSSGETIEERAARIAERNRVDQHYSKGLSDAEVVKRHQELSDHKAVQEHQALSQHPAVQAYEANKAAVGGGITGSLAASPSGLQALSGVLGNQ